MLEISDEVDPRSAKRVGEGRRAPSLFDGGDNLAGEDGLGAGERPVRKGVVRARRCCSGRHRGWSDRKKQGCISLHLRRAGSRVRDRGFGGGLYFMGMHPVPPPKASAR